MTALNDWRGRQKNRDENHERVERMEMRIMKGLRGEGLVAWRGRRDRVEMSLGIFFFFFAFLSLG
jgi:hypothetical protein